MRRDPTEFRARFKAYKEGKMPYDAGLPKFAEGTGGVENNITEEYAPLASNVYQPMVDEAKQKVVKFAVDDYTYRVQKQHPEITKEQVQKVYNNTPYIGSDSRKGTIVGQYWHGEDDGYGRRVMIYPRGMKSDDPEFNLQNRIYSTVLHESNHLFRDAVLGGKYTDKEREYLESAYPGVPIDDAAALNSQIREKLSTAYGNGATGKKLDTTLEKVRQNKGMQNEMMFHLNNLNGYGHADKVNGQWDPKIIDAMTNALINVASVQKQPRRGLLQAKDGKLPEYGDGTDALLQLTKGGVSMIPGAGTLIDGWDFYNNPSLENLGYLALSGIGDAAIFTGIGAPFGFSLKAIKSAAKLNKTRRTLNAVMSANKAGNAIQLHNAKKAYNASKAATRALAAETGNLVDTAKSTYEAYTK